MRNLKTAGTIIQVFALLIPLAAILYALAALTTYYPLNALFIFAGGLLIAAILFGIGASFKALVAITEDSRRSADALEFMARRRQRVRTQPGVYPTPTHEIPLPPPR